MRETFKNEQWFDDYVGQYLECGVHECVMMIHDYNEAKSTGTTRNGGVHEDGIEICWSRIQIRSHEEHDRATIDVKRKAAASTDAALVAVYVSL